ncbi:MAG: nucleotide exchange factor GrpE [Halorubrum sp.]
MSDDDAVEVETPESADTTDAAAEDPDTDASSEGPSGQRQDDAGPHSTGNGTADTDDEPDTGAGGETSTDDSGAADEDSLADRVAAHDPALADEVAELEAELAERREEVDELTSKLARVRADFSNYKERAKRKRDEIRERASESLVERIVPVRNDLLRALDQDEESDIRPGVRSTLEKFDEVLAAEGVEPIDPEPGTDVDPARHQVMLRVESDQPEGTVHEVYEPGYEMGDRVIVEAQVTVSADET